MARRGMNKTVSDQARHLDIVGKAKGISGAENYFIGLPESSKNHLCYGALLNCYCKELMTEEAEALMEKMKELNFPLSSISYNSLMTLYEKTCKPEKILAIIQEMKAAGVKLDCFSYNVWMRAFAAVNNISGVERVIDEVNRDGQVSDWTTYSNLASIYVDAGLFEKAENALKELEKRIGPRKECDAFHFLITLYGRTGNLLEVYRVWRSLRLAHHSTTNTSYLNMIQTLVKLNDLPGAEKCYSEWETGRSLYDVRIANVLIGAYAKDNLLEKALALKERARRGGAKPNVKTWEIFLDYYLRLGDFKSAGDCVANAVSIGRRNGEKWIPPQDIVKTLMRHFEQEKDVDGAERLLEILRKVQHGIGEDVYECLIRTYAAVGRTSPTIRRRLKMDEVEVSEASKKLLEEICVD